MGHNRESINVSGITIEWDRDTGTCLFENLPVAMMWVDTTLAGLMAGVQEMVGTERFALALQSEGRKSVKDDWLVISQFATFEEGFQAISQIAAVAGWGQWEIVSIDLMNQKCVFRTKNTWEGKYQKSLGVCWGSGMLAGKLAGYCSRLFEQNCWAEQTSFIARGDEFDTFKIQPSDKTIENEIESLLSSDDTTKADMAVALKKLRTEIEARRDAEKGLLKSQRELELRIEDATKKVVESEKKYRSLIEHTGDIVTQVDSNGVLVYVNHTSLKIWGIPPEKGIGLTATQFVHPNDRPKTEEWFARCVAAKTKQASIENRQINSKTGNCYTVLWSSTFQYNGSGSLAGVGSIGRDITEFRVVEQKYQNIVDKMLDGFALHEMIYDSQGEPCDYRFLSVNPAFERLTGLKAQNLTGKRVSEVIPGIEQYWIDIYGKVVATGESVFFENYSADLDKCFEITAYRPERGHFATIFQDISNRKKAEKELEERTKFLDKIIESSAVSTWISDEKGTAIRTNPACLKFFGAAESEVIGKYNLFKDSVLENQGFLPVIKEVFEKAKPASLIIDYDFAAVDHVDVEHATHKIIKTVLTPVIGDDGNVSNAIVQAIDLTDIKKSEEALRESEERHRFLYNNTPAMLQSMDTNGVLLSVNDTWLHKLGYSREEVVGKKSIDFIAEESQRYALEEVRPEFYRKGYCTDINYKFVKKNGDKIDVLLSATAERDKEGNIVRSLAVLEDVTEKKRLEEQLRHAQKMEAIGTLTGGIAHDFNNILAAILGYTELATSDIPDWNPAKRQLEEVLKAGNRAKDLVKQILAFSRKAERNQVPVKMHLLINETLNFLRASLPTTIEIKSAIDPSCGTVLADPTQMHQVVMNLCTNAFQAMEKDGGVLKVELSTVELSARDLADEPSKIPGSYILFSVTDTGVGINNKHLSQIFDPYFTTKEIGKGTGMGLAVVHGIVHSHDGLLKVKSSYGEGSTFEMFLPMIDDEPEDAVDDVHPLPTGMERVLVIDDDESIATLTQARLKKAGYRAVVKTSSTEVLELFRANPDAYDLIITDQTMPIMTGDQLAAELLKIRPDISIIMCTGYSSRISAEKASRIGIKAFVLKPVGEKELMETIRQVLDNS